MALLYNTKDVSFNTTPASAPNHRSGPGQQGYDGVPYPTPHQYSPHLEGQESSISTNQGIIVNDGCKVSNQETASGAAHGAINPVSENKEFVASSANWGKRTFIGSDQYHPSKKSANSADNVYIVYN